MTLGSCKLSKANIHFLETPVQVCPTPMMVSVENQVLLDIEVQKLASKEAIHLLSPGEGEQGFLSTLFPVPKKRGEQRPVVLNQRRKSLRVMMGKAVDGAHAICMM